MKILKSKQVIVVHKRNLLTMAMVGLIITFAGLLKTLGADNLLVNGDFNSPAATATATGWTPWTYGGGWANHQNDSYNFDGSYYIAVGGGNSGTSGGGIYQTVSGLPGYTYNLTVESGVQSWWWPEGEMRLFFLDVSNNVLSETISNVTTSITAYDTGLPWASYSLSATAPANTKYVKVEFASQSGTGTVFFDDASLTSTYDAPTITDVYPNGYTLLQYTNTLAFTVASDTTGIAADGIQLILNGIDVSSNLTIGGGPLGYNVSCSTLQSNQIYTAVITVTDTNGIQTTASYNFDTYNPTYLWEAEDWDFTNGMYINDPMLTSSNAPNSYFGVIGVQQVDELDTDGNPPGSGAGPQNFRPGDPMSTDIAGDTPRQNFLDAQLIDSNIQDYAVGYFSGSEWVNYTRNFPTGKYYIYARLAAGTAGVIGMDLVTSGQGTVSQTTNYLGAFQMPALGWNTYSYIPLTDSYGNKVAVSLDGVNTLRANAANAGGNMNFFFIVPANTSAPVITNIYPNGLVLFQATNQFAFQVYSPAEYNIITNDIHLTLNGVDVSSKLTETGTESSWSVNYAGLKANTAYTAVIYVSDTDGNSSSATITFDTYNPSFTWEGEDWDFGNGQFIDSPALSSTPQADSYFGQTGVQGIDENTENDAGESLASSGAQFLYRSGDAISTGSAEDTPRQNFLEAQIANPNIQDYMLGWFNPGMWVNYTRTFPTGTYNIYVRAAYGNGGTSSLYFDQVVSGRGTGTQGIAHVGSFTIPSDGWTTYSYVPCIDRFGNLAQVTLNGMATFRLTAGSANVNFFMLVPARTDLPRIANVYPDGTTLLQGTNNLAFTVLTASNPVISVSTNKISLTLNGVSAPLAFTADGQNWNVTTPLTANITNYTARINVADTAGNSVSTTIYFDTFSGNDFIWEAEDYDYNGGVSIDNPIPTSAPADGSYFGLNGEQGIDYDYVSIATGSLFLYRSDDFIATDICPDTPLQKYVTARLSDPAVQDYYVGWWATNSWINYTRTYPSGNFNVYARLSGNAGANYSVQLQEVNGEITNTLGGFNGAGRGYNSYDWIPLTVNGTNAAVSLGGVATLRVTTDGQVNANRYMLVPVVSSGLSVYITVSVSNNNVQLSFPTQSDHTYEIEYKDNLADTSWASLAAYSGDGSVQTHNVGVSTNGARFYRVVTQ